MSKKKDPVLWVVVDKDGQTWASYAAREYAANSAERFNAVESDFAPFRVVKYLPAPKKRKNRK